LLNSCWLEFSFFLPFLQFTVGPMPYDYLTTVNIDQGLVAGSRDPPNTNLTRLFGKYYRCHTLRKKDLRHSCISTVAVVIVSNFGSSLVPLRLRSSTLQLRKFPIIPCDYASFQFRVFFESIVRTIATMQFYVATAEVSNCELSFNPL
jgi:hypothetical protein